MRQRDRRVLILSFQAVQEGPPKEAGPFRTPDLVELTTLDPGIRLDIRYATTNNLAGRAGLHRGAGVSAAARGGGAGPRAPGAKPQGFGLLVFDGYRPWRVTKLFWDVTPPEKHEFVADPAKGSKHNRGCAVDLSMYDLKTRQAKSRCRASTTRCRRAPTPITPAAPPRRASAATSCAPRWSTKASPSSRTSGGTSTTRTGSEYPILDIPFAEIRNGGRK